MHELTKQIVETIRTVEASEKGCTLRVVSWPYSRKLLEYIAADRGLIMERTRVNKRFDDFTLSVGPEFEETFKGLIKLVHKVAKEAGGNFSAARNTVVDEIREALDIAEESDDENEATADTSDEDETEDETDEDSDSDEDDGADADDSTDVDSESDSDADSDSDDDGSDDDGETDGDDESGDEVDGEDDDSPEDEVVDGEADSDEDEDEDI